MLAMGRLIAARFEWNLTRLLIARDINIKNHAWRTPVSDTRHLRYSFLFAFLQPGLIVFPLFLSTKLLHSSQF
jgi:hypothetical protein